MKRKIILSSLLLVIIILIFTGCGTDSGDETSVDARLDEDIYLNIGTGGTAGTYFPLGGAFADIWNNNISNANVTAQSTGGAVANVNLLYDGNIEIGLVQNDLAYYAYNGEAMFEEYEFLELRGLATLFDEPMQIVTTDMSINTLTDLKGKVVSIGSIGSGTETNSRQIIAAAGLDIENDIDVRFLSHSETVDAMKDNQVDVGILTTGIPNSGIQELSLTRDVKVLSVDEEIANELKDEYPFYSDFIIPAGTYEGQTKDANSLTVRAMLMVRDNMSDDIAYELTKLVFENHERVAAAHTVGEHITPENSQIGMSVPLHQGAEKYFSEIGIIE